MHNQRYSNKEFADVSSSRNPAHQKHNSGASILHGPHGSWGRPLTAARLKVLHKVGGSHPELRNLQVGNGDQQRHPFGEKEVSDESARVTPVSSSVREFSMEKFCDKCRPEFDFECTNCRRARIGQSSCTRIPLQVKVEKKEADPRINPIVLDTYYRNHTPERRHNPPLGPEHMQAQLVRRDGGSKKQMGRKMTKPMEEKGEKSNRTGSRKFTNKDDGKYQANERYQAHRQGASKRSPSNSKNTVFDSRAFLRAYISDERKRHIFNSDKYGVRIDSRDLTQYQRCMLFIDGKIINTVVAVLVITAMILLIYQLFTEDNRVGLMFTNMTITGLFAFELLARCVCYGKSLRLRPMVLVDFVVVFCDALAIYFGDPRVHAFRLFRMFRVSRIGKPSNVSKLLSDDGLATGPEKISNDVGHVTWYIPNHLFSHGWLFTFTGTVTRSRNLWTQAIMFLILSALFASTLCSVDCYDELLQENRNCRDCTLPVGEGAMILATLLAAVILGIFLSTTFARWWECRERVANLIGDIRNFIQMVVASVPGEDEISQDFMHIVIRLQIAAFIMFTQELRAERNLKLLVDQGFLRNIEKRLLKSIPNRYYIVYSWVRSEIWKFQREHPNLLGVHSVEILDQFMVRQQNQMEAIVALIETQIPYILVHLVALTAKMQILITSLWASSFIRYGVDQNSYVTLIFGFVVILLTNLIIEGILQVHCALFDPFGYNAVDFPLHVYVRSVISLSDALITRKYPRKRRESV